MKICLATLNSKYTHTSLALRLIQAYIAPLGHEVVLREYTINTPLYQIIGQLHRECADLLLFSSYIWNGYESLRIAESLKALRPELLIGLGGPEVSFNAEEVLNNQPYIDFVLRGEGEQVVYDLVNALSRGGALTSVNGLSYRLADQIMSNPEPLPLSMDTLSFPYQDLALVKDRILYYESSRGCPYNCSYCLSSATKGIRYRDMGLVKADLDAFVSAGVKQVKFIDRTFNANPDRALALWQLMAELDDGQINFHFEITAELLRDKDIAFLRTLRAGLFQFEIGVQTTMKEASEAVNRRLSFDKLKVPVTALQERSNIHIHLDLIAGLPYEGYERFLKSFDDVYGLNPQVLQLGFLKLIKGSAVSRQAEGFGYVYESFAPYEVLASRWISFDEMLLLKDMEEVLEQIHNSKRYILSLERMLRFYERPSKLFIDFAAYLRGLGCLDEAMSADRWANQWYNFSKTVIDRAYHLELSLRLALDYFASFGKLPPEWLELGDCILDAKAAAFEVVKGAVFESVMLELLPLSPKERIKKIRYLGLSTSTCSHLQGIISKGDLWHDYSDAFQWESDQDLYAVLVIDTTDRHPVLERYPLHLFIKG